MKEPAATICVRCKKVARPFSARVGATDLCGDCFQAWIEYKAKAEKEAFERFLVGHRPKR